MQFSSGGITVDVHAWAETGAEAPASSGYYKFETAQVHSWATGLGNCNRDEGLASVSCNDNEHEVDSVGRDDLMVFFFNQTVDFSQLEISVDPYDGSGSDPNDRDIRYWISTVAAAPDLSTYTFNTLAPTFGTGALSAASSSYGIYTHYLNGANGGAATGNLLLISGNYKIRSCSNYNGTSDTECEAYKIKSLSVAPVIPVPAAAWLMGSALAAIGLLRRRIGQVDLHPFARQPE